MADFNTAYATIPGFEGGYQDMPTDTGNYCDNQLVGTNFGVSAPAYKQAFGVCPTQSDMQNLTQEQAKQIAKTNYWDYYLQGDKIQNQGIAGLLMDSVWGSGSLGVKETREAINQVYGAGTVNESTTPVQLTDNEIDLINGADPTQLGNALYSVRSAFFQNSGSTFTQGWMNRLNALYNDVQGYFTNAETFVVNNTGLFIAIAGLTALAIGFTIYEVTKKK